MVELKYKAKAIGATGDDFGADDFLYMGTGPTRGMLMVCPQLEEFVAAEMSKEGAVLKERRKLTEERRLARGRGKGEKGKGRGGKEEKEE